MRYSAGMGRVSCGPIVLVCVLAAVMPRASAQQPQIPVVVERVEVARVLIDVRVVDDHGRAIRGLQREDFDVEIGGTHAEVESVQWIGEHAPVAARATAAADNGLAAASAPGAIDVTPPGRLIVFVVQKSLTGNRVGGLLRMLDQSGTILAALNPSDRVAVLSFDSHLNIWQDFTGDFARVRTALGRVMRERAPPLEPAAGPSLAAQLDPMQAYAASTIEQALLRLGEALAPLPGAKSVVLIGYGFGRMGLGGTYMENGYEEAAHALQRARATFFCLDVTDADYHSLEAGLQNVASDTGGVYARTHEFSQRALNYVVQALAGHYVLLVEKPAIEEGPQPLTVRLSGRAGRSLTVLSHTKYVQ